MFLQWGFTGSEIRIYCEKDSRTLEREKVTEWENEIKKKEEKLYWDIDMSWALFDIYGLVTWYLKVSLCRGLSA